MPVKVRRIKFSLSEDSIFSRVVRKKQTHIGKLTDTPVNRMFISMTGGSCLYDRNDSTYQPDLKLLPCYTAIMLLQKSPIKGPRSSGNFYRTGRNGYGKRRVAS